MSKIVNKLKDAVAPDRHDHQTKSTTTTAALNDPTYANTLDQRVETSGKWREISVE